MCSVFPRIKALHLFTPNFRANKGGVTYNRARLTTEVKRLKRYDMDPEMGVRLTTGKIWYAPRSHFGPVTSLQYLQRLSRKEADYVREMRGEHTAWMTAYLYCTSS